MQDWAAEGPGEGDEARLLLETVVAAHYLALQMRLLARNPAFFGREATEFLAAALGEWARLAEADWERTASLIPAEAERVSL
jgi:hypothetical protein